MRLFLAVPLPEEVKHGLASLLTSSLPDLPGKPVPPQNWHLTLRFLGSVSDHRYESLLHRLEEADLGPDFKISFDGLGAFPRAEKAVVLWMGVGRGEDELLTLASATEKVVVSAGFEREERPFEAHLTLARIRPPVDVWSYLEAQPRLPGSFVVDRVAVYRSHLGSGVARHELLEEVPLGP